MYDVIKTLPQCCNNVATALTIGRLDAFNQGAPSKNFKKNYDLARQFGSPFCVLYSVNLIFFDKL